MKNSDILMVVDIVSAEKGVNKELIFQAIELALATATKKHSREDIEVRIAIDRNSGSYQAFRRWEVIADEDHELLEAPSRQLLLSVAQERDADITVGDFIEEPMKSVELGRISAQHARHVIFQKVREAEREQILDTYQNRVGEMISGVIKRSERSGITLDLGNNVEGFVPREQQIPRDPIRPGDRIRALLYKLEPEARGPMLYLSRTASELLIELFRVEVPEINEGMIKIVNATRDPGVRAKIAVYKLDSRIDPIGACVGMRGSRVQAVSNELAGERVDIILWDENPAQYVINALAPAEVVSILVDEDTHSMDVAVSEENLSMAIGRNGQNVRLASQLCDWTLNVLSEEQAEEKNEAEAEQLRELFKEKLGVDDEIANILIQEGFSSIEEVAYVPEKEMLEIDEFDHTLVTELRGRANDILITQAIASEVQLSDRQVSEELLNMEGMDTALANKLISHGILTVEELADQSVGELMEIDGMNEALAAKLIMTARQPMFEQQEQSAESG